MLLTIVNCLIVFTSASWCGSLCTEQSNICNQICGTDYMHELEFSNTLLMSAVKRWKYQAALPTTSNDPVHLEAQVVNLQVELANLQVELLALKVELPTCLVELSTCQVELEEYEQSEASEVDVEVKSIFVIMVLMVFICWL